MSGGPSKIIIKVESSSEQQENLRNARKTLKVLQKSAFKENLVGRVLSGKENSLKNDASDIIEFKRKKYISQSVQTELIHITEDDLTSENNPSETYWEVLAEKRRAALEDTLKENENLHEKVNTLEDKLNTSFDLLNETIKEKDDLREKLSMMEDELNTSRKMLDETRNLVEVLQEMLQENEDVSDSSLAEEVLED